MRTKILFVKAICSIMLLIVTWSMSGPVTRAAAPSILIDDSNPATLCGSYTGKPASNDLVAAIGGAGSGSTVIICPGTYNPSGLITITGKKLTIKRALKGPDSQPILTPGSSAIGVFQIDGGSAVTMEGIVIDARGNSYSGFAGIALVDAAGTFSNMAIYGSATTLAGIYATASPNSLGTVSISNTMIDTYTTAGVAALGPIKLTISGCTLDGALSSGTSMAGVYVDFGSTPNARSASVTLTKNLIIHNGAGIEALDTSKSNISGNTFIGNIVGVYLTSFGQQASADGSKIAGNTILDVPPNGVGIFVENGYTASTTMKSISISKNTIEASQYIPTSTSISAIWVYADTPAHTTVTATISGNTLLNFSPAQRIRNDSDHAGLKI